MSNYHWGQFQTQIIIWSVFQNPVTYTYPGHHDSVCLMGCIHASKSINTSVIITSSASPPFCSVIAHSLFEHFSYVHCYIHRYFFMLDKKVATF